MACDIKIHNSDLASDVKLVGDLAIDTEAMGLILKRDRLCLVQICDENRAVHMVKFNISEEYNAPNLKKYLEDKSRKKIFHFGRFDIAILRYYLGINDIPNVFCTKIASKFARTYSEYHGLQTIVRELLGHEVKKEQRSSYWGSSLLTATQQEYAKNDVYYLHRVKDKLVEMLQDLGRLEICLNHCEFLKYIVESDIIGFTGDMFSHS